MVRCADCGYLSLRNIETRELDEAEEAFRQFGEVIGVSRSYPSKIEGTEFSTGDTFNVYIHERLPMCFARNQDFIKQFTDLAAKGYGLDTSIESVINGGRQCAAFVEWRQGSTPKEHQVMVDRQWQEKFNEQRRRDDRKWHWIELAAIIAGTGFFTLLGAWIASPK